MKFLKVFSSLAATAAFSSTLYATDHGLPLYQSKLISLNELPPVKEARMVLSMARDLIENECLYNSANSLLAINAKAITLPATVFEYITTLACDVSYKNLVVMAANDTTNLTTTNSGVNPVVAAKVTYAAGTGQTASKSFYLVAVGSDGKAMKIDTAAVVGDEVPQNGSVVYDYCIALDHSDGGTWFMWTLGSSAAAAGTLTNVRDIASALGHEFCTSAQ